MASPGNPTPAGGGQFDMHKLFKPSTPPPPPTATSAPNSNPNPQNFTSNASTNPNLASAPFPPPSASYPPPTGAGGGPYPYSPQTSPFHYHPVYPAYSNPLPPNQDFANVHPQRSMSYPTPPLQPQVQPPTSLHHHNNLQNPPNPQNPNNPGSRLMALLSAPPSTMDIPPQSTVSTAQIHPTSSVGSDFSGPQNANITGLGSGVSHQGPVIRMPSSKLPKGRHLIGDQLVYDVDVRLPGEVQPQLEVTPITKYGSDPGLVLGRQIAVNKTYICYGLKLGAIRVLNINTALRSLLKGLAQRVTDMAFFAEDVHLLASASVDGRVYVWKITEGPDEEDKPQITGRIVSAIQVTGEGESVHPRVCWHCHKQEVLVVGIGRHVLKIDTTKVGKGEKFSTEEPLKCSTDKLIDGIHLVGSHDGEVTDLSMCQWMTTRLVSASVDGTWRLEKAPRGVACTLLSGSPIKIWEDRKSLPIAVLRPHDSQPIHSVTFLAAPHRPDHIVLITGGPLNREIKIWISASEEGWLLPSDAESWHCTQTLVLKSSEARLEEAFFNQVVALSQASLLILANAKRNAIYAVHLEYGPNPAATRLDYIAEFTVTMPILSFTGTSELLPHGEQIVQVYCVQTQAIQQYALDLSQCVPSPMENVPYEKSDSSVSLDAANSERFTSVEPSGSKPSEKSVSSSAPKTSTHEIGLENAPKVRYPVTAASALQECASSSMESKSINLSTTANESDISFAASSPLPLSPRMSRSLSADQKIAEYSVHRQIDTSHSNLSDVASLDDDSRNDDGKPSQDDISMPLNHPIKFKHPTHLVTPSEILMASSSSEVNLTNEPPSEGELNTQEVVMSNDTRNAEVEVNVVGEMGFGQDDDIGSREPQTFVSENKEKAFCSQASDLGMEMAREYHALSPETYLVEEARQFSGTGGIEADTLPSTIVEEEVHDSAKDVTGKVIDSSTPMPAQHPELSTKAKKGKKQKEKSVQGSGPASPPRSAFNSTDSSVEPGISSSTTPVETTVSQMSSMQEMMNQLMSMQKEMQKQMAVMVAVPVTKEGKRLETALGRSMEKAVKANSDALWARLQEENAKQEKAARDRMQQLSIMISNCLNKELPAIIEKTVKRELTTEAMKASLEVSVVPAFEMSCRTMFEQVDAAFQKGMGEHTTAAQQQVEASHSPLALALRDALNSATSITQTLGGELLDGQRKLLALADSKAPNLLISQLSNGPLGLLHEKLEVPPDPTTELSRLIGERKYEEAFNAALQRTDVNIVSWLCTQVDLPGILSMNPLPLGQGVLLSLLQQLACDIGKDTPRKLTWMREVVSAINPTDPMILVHVRPIFEQVYQILNHHRSFPTTTGAELSNIRLIMHVINSMIMSSK
ncbi:varicose-related protein [Phtheirospermum japonicum]|uniref:Varicose-related protein n=1 Tax=Phtheirospermum japonicum TaxID=374723 RepID=A0A830BX33_9LAMI|nr:varicose-related protein [Phtheirospermum japonicum]